MGIGLMDGVIIAVLASVVAALGFTGLAVRRLALRVAAQERLIRDQENTLQALCAGARGLGDGLRALEQRMKGTQHRLDDLDLGEPRQGLYRQAIERARAGADLKELVERFGLEPGEAELVQSLHRGSPGQVNRVPVPQGKQ